MFASLERIDFIKMSSKSLDMCIMTAVGSTIVSQPISNQRIVPYFESHHTSKWPSSSRRKYLCLPGVMSALTSNRLVTCIAWSLGRPLNLLFDPFESVVRSHQIVMPTKLDQLFQIYRQSYLVVCSSRTPSDILLSVTN